MCLPIHSIFILISASLLPSSVQTCTIDYYLLINFHYSCVSWQHCMISVNHVSYIVLFRGIWCQLFMPSRAMLYNIWDLWRVRNAPNNGTIMRVRFFNLFFHIYNWYFKCNCIIKDKGTDKCCRLIVQGTPIHP